MSVLQAYKDTIRFHYYIDNTHKIKLQLFMNRCDNEMTEDALRLQQYTWRLEYSINSLMTRSRSGWSTISLDPTTYKFELDKIGTPLSPGIKWELVDEWEGSGETLWSLVGWVFE